MKKLEPIIVGQEQPKIDQINAEKEQAIPLLLDVWNAFKECPFYDPQADLHTLLLNHDSLKRDYIQKLVREMHPVPEGSVLQLDVSKEAEKYQLPTPKLDIAISHARAFFSNSTINLKFFSVKRNKIVCDDKEVEKYMDRYTTKAYTPLGINVYEKGNKAMQAMMEFQEALDEAGAEMRFLHKLHPAQVNRLFTLDNDGQYKWNPAIFKRIQKKAAVMEPVEEGQ